MKIKPSDLKIGVELYQYNSSIMPYKIIGVNQLETDAHIEKFYILECQSCDDHEKCQVAVKFNDHGDIVYSHMINAYEHDDDGYHKEHEHYRNSQYYWHTTDEKTRWFLTRKDARLYIYERNIAFFKTKIEEAQKKITDLEKSISEQIDKINALNNE